MTMIRFGRVHPLALASLAGLLMLLVASTGPAARANNEWTRWVTGDVHVDQAVGRIWSVADQAFIAPDMLVSDLKAARFALLGEVHDNSSHHRLQAWLIDRLGDGDAISIVMEMLSQDQAPELAAFMASLDRTSDGFADAVTWHATGWPDFELYRPIIDTALRRNAAIYAGLPSSSATRAVSRSGLAALPAGEQADLRLAEPLSPGDAADLRQEIQEAHCNLLPVEALPNMVAVQRFRDAVLAQSLRGAPKTGPAILIAGNGHVRSDRGVPAFLSANDGSAIAVILREVEPDLQIGAVSGLFPPGTPADYVWLTPRIERPDPCEKLRERFGTSAPGGSGG
ncbi:MAG: ChaN family lipoprotein [Roseibium sp.]|nr:ChaN family lipoprotein [Roseibium sp.]